MKNVTILIGFLSLGFAAALALRSELPDEGRNPQAIDSPLKLELQANPLAVKFVNVSKRPLHILKPLDGSECCWIMPHYKLAIRNENGDEIPHRSRCGLFGFPYTGTKWPDDYAVTIEAGGSYIHRIEFVHNIPEAGAYTFRFEYRFTPVSDFTPGGRYPMNLWQGTAESNTIVMKLTSPR